MLKEGRDEDDTDQHAAALLYAAAAIFCSHRVALIDATMQDFFITIYNFFITIYKLVIATMPAPTRNMYKKVVHGTCVQRIRETSKIYAFESMDLDFVMIYIASTINIDGSTGA